MHIAGHAFQRVDVITAPIDCATEAEFLNLLEGSIRQRRLCRLAPVSAAVAVMAQENPRFRELLWRFEIAVPDGKWVALAGRHLLGHPIPGQVATPLLVRKLLALSVQRGYRVYFLGATQQVVTQAVERSKQHWRGLQVAGFEDGYAPVETWSQIAERVAASEAEVLLIGMPSPMKEAWAIEYGGRANVPVIICCGGMLDILAGKVRAAPRWVSAIGMEWFYRVIQEPTRLGPRYLRTNPKYIAGVTRQAIARRRQSAA